MVEDIGGGRDERDERNVSKPTQTDLLKPVRIGGEYEIDIKEMSQRGEGIARIEGLVIFVPKSRVGDHARIRITSISRKFAEAELVERQKHEEEETGPL